MDFLKDIISATENVYASIAEDGIKAGDVAGFIDTGSYALNALLSGSMFKGAPSNKVVAFAGEEATGKTYFTLSIIGKFLQDNPEGFVIYFESESAISKDMLQSRGIDTKRVAVNPVRTIEDFRTQAMKALRRYGEMDEKSRPPLAIVLDSLGNCSTNKEIGDMTEGKDTRDMTRPQLIKGAFRAITLELGLLNVPLFLTNHIYNVVGSYIPTKEMSGGSGLRYAASTVIFLTKRKERGDDKTVVGNIIKCTAVKSRLSIENQSVEVLLRYDTGIDRYHGVLDLAMRVGMVEKVGTKLKFPDGSTHFGKHINAEPEKYFTQEFLSELDERIAPLFQYGSDLTLEEEDEDEGS
jgi:RecA/RadA recombinase